MNSYIVCIKEDYVRDAEILATPRALTNEEYERLNNNDTVDIDGERISWQEECCARIFVCTVDAENEDEAKQIVCEETGYPIEILELILIKEGEVNA